MRSGFREIRSPPAEFNLTLELFVFKMMKVVEMDSCCRRSDLETNSSGDYLDSAGGGRVSDKSILYFHFYLSAVAAVFQARQFFDDFRYFHIARLGDSRDDVKRLGHHS